MSEFINNNSNSIFALLMLIVSLLIPTISERVKIKYQLKVDNTKRDKSTYDSLLSRMFEFNEASRFLWTQIKVNYNEKHELNYKGQDMTYTDIRDRYLIPSYNIIFEVYFKSLNIDRKLYQNFGLVVKNMNEQIFILSTLGNSNIQEISNNLTPLVMNYANVYFDFKRAIKKIID